MTRKENGNENGFAGVEAVKVYLKFWAKGNILLYVWDVNLAL